MATGWKNESERHSLARNGVKTNTPMTKKTEVDYPYKDWIKEFEKETGLKVVKDSIKERDYFGYTVIEFETTKGEWQMVESEDVAEKMAIEQVKEDLENEPEIFVNDWLISQIDDGKAEDVFRNMYTDWDWDYVNDIESESDKKYPNRLISEMVSMGIINSEEDLTDENELKSNIDIDSLKEKMVEQLVDDKINEGGGGFEHYKFNFGDADAKKMVLEHNLIDIDSAVESAVQVDGWAHFLSHYDGGYEYTKSDKVYWRTN